MILKALYKAKSVQTLPPPQAFLIESSNRCGRKFRDAQAVLTLAGKVQTTKQSLQSHIFILGEQLSDNLLVFMNYFYGFYEYAFTASNLCTELSSAFHI